MFHRIKLGKKQVALIKIASVQFTKKTQVNVTKYN